MTNAEMIKECQLEAEKYSMTFKITTVPLSKMKIYKFVRMSDFQSVSTTFSISSAYEKVYSGYIEECAQI